MLLCQEHKQNAQGISFCEEKGIFSQIYEHNGSHTVTNLALIPHRSCFCGSLLNTNAPSNGGDLFVDDTIEIHRPFLKLDQLPTEMRCHNRVNV